MPEKPVIAPPAAMMKSGAVLSLKEGESIVAIDMVRMTFSNGGFAAAACLPAPSRWKDGAFRVIMETNNNDHLNEHS
jgi:hypothetical protein